MDSHTDSHPYGRELRIDELAKEARTTIRNVRAYQERGILPPPRREGRVAWYSEAHLARLRIVNALLERGYSIANIEEIVGTWERGGDLRELLGLEEAITSPFTNEAPTRIDMADLADMFGTADPAIATRAAKVGLIELDGLRAVVPSMRLLRAGLELYKSGVPLDALLDELGQLRRDLDRIGNRLVDMIFQNVIRPAGDPIPRGAEAARLAERIRRVRPLAEVVVTTLLAFSLEKHVRVRLGERFSRILELGRPKTASRGRV